MAEMPKANYVLITKKDRYAHAASTNWETIRGVADNFVLADVRHGNNPNNWLIRVFDNDSGELLGEYVVAIEQKSVPRVSYQYVRIR